MIIAHNRLRLGGASLLAAALLAASSVHADNKLAPQMPAAPHSQVRMPGAEQIVILIRTTLITLNDALATGNFTVLRDRAAPSFQGPNTAARLSRIFRDLDDKGIDLAGVAMAVPQLTAAPRIDADQRLHVDGKFLLQPTAIDFGLMFEMSGGQWRLFGISVNPAPVAPVAAAPLTRR